MPRSTVATYDLTVPRDYRSLAGDGVEAAYQADETSSKTLRGLSFSMAAGRPHGALATGYRRVYDDRGNLVEQVIDAATGPVVQRIFEAVAGGEPVQQVCAADSGGRGAVASGTRAP